MSVLNKCILAFACSMLFGGSSLAAELTVGIRAQESSAVGDPVSFGLSFSPGELPYSKSLSGTIVKNGDSIPVAIQLDRLASHCADLASTGQLLFEFKSKKNCSSAGRSVRHAVVSVHLPLALEKNEQLELKLSDSDDASEGTGLVVWPEDLQIRTELNNGSELLVADLSSLSAVDLRGTDLPKAGTSSEAIQEWLAGPLVREWIVRVPFRKDGNIDELHDHLVARYHIRHYGMTQQTRVDVIVENNWSFVPDVKSHNYGVNVFINGKLRYTEPELLHFIHSRWRVTLWDNPRTELQIVYDAKQLISSGVSPQYNESLINSLGSSIRSKYDDLWGEYQPTTIDGVLKHPKKVDICLSAIDEVYDASCDSPTAHILSVNGLGPMGIGIVPARAMAQTGGRPEIAPLPEWTAAWILDQRYSTYKMMLGIGNGSGSWPVHFRDEATDLPISIVDRPDAYLNYPHATHSSHLETCKAAQDCQRPYIADTAHQASFVFLPYIVTGDFFYLEELQFFAGFNAVAKNTLYRGGDKGLFQRTSQIRGAAWSLRNLGHAAYSTPDNHQLKASLLYQLEANLDEYNAIYIDDPTARVSWGGALDYTRGISPPWMDDYFTWAVSHLTELGYKSWSELAKWKGLYPVHRMGLGGETGDDFCWIFASAYRLRLEPFDAGDPTPVVMIKSGLNTSLDVRPMFRDFADVFKYSNRANFNVGLTGSILTKEACASSEQAKEQGLQLNEMVGYAYATAGYVAQLQPALAAAVDRDSANSSAAWDRFENRGNKPDYADGPAWAIVPRKYSSLNSNAGGQCTVDQR